MVRSRSPRKQEAPLRIPRRKTSASPASARIADPTSRTRALICSSVKTGVMFCTRALHPHFVEHSPRGCGHLEALRDLHTADPDDFAVPEQQRQSISAVCGDFTINQEILQLFRTRKSKWLKAVAVAAVADDEARRGAGRKLEALPAAAQSLANADRQIDLRNVDRTTGFEAHLELGRGFASPLEKERVAMPDEVDIPGNADAGHTIELFGEPPRVEIASVWIEPPHQTLKQRLPQPELARPVPFRGGRLGCVDGALQQWPLLAGLLGHGDEVVDGIELP